MTAPSLTVAVAVPTLNGSRWWKQFCTGLRSQNYPIKHVLVLDSMSEDGTADLARSAGFDVLPIERADFNHGGTRQLAVDQLCDVDVIVFLTQDAVLANPDSLCALLAPFADPAVGATYGRQLPRPGASAIEAHARLFNYPGESRVRTWEDRHSLGIKAAFLSNSFAAYRRTAIMSVGGFPTHTIIAEDALVAGRLLMAGWKTAYAARAEAYHSHSYTVAEEFSRYFDTGVYHSRETWLLASYGDAGGEGNRFVFSELKYLLKHAPYLIPSALMRSVAKIVGYKLGRLEPRLSRDLCRRLSMQKRFWDHDALSRNLH